MPQYETDLKLKIDREIKHPPANMYKDLGWDVDKTTKRKHYRYLIDKELEKYEDFMERESPFHKFPLYRGQSRGLENDTGLFSFFNTTDVDASGSLTDHSEVGYFKGLVKLDNTSNKDDRADQVKSLEAEMIGLIKEFYVK